MKESTSYLDRHRFVPWILLCVSIIATFLVWFVVSESINQTLQSRFEQKVGELESALVERMLNYEQVLRGTQGLFAASIEVNRDEWHQYVTAQKTNERFPGIQGLGYSHIIGGPEKLPEHVDKIRSEGFPSYTLHPVGDRNEYHSIIYIEPMDERNLQAFGLDMTFEENRREAMEKARDSGEATLTGKITLIQEMEDDAQAGFLMMLPIYKNGVPHDTVLQRQEAIQGYVYGAFRMDDLMSEVLGTTYSDISYIIYDEEISEQNIMFESELSIHNSEDMDPYQQKICIINFGDRNWVVDFYTMDRFTTGTENTIPIFIVFFGLTISGLLFYTTNSFNSARTRIEKLTKATKQFSEDMEVDIDPSLKNSKHETANLATAFEKMQKSISTKNKQLEDNVKELEKINALKEEFTAMISHELKTPLTPIIGWCDALMDKKISGPLSDTQKDGVSTIRSNGLKLLSLIGDMLDAQMLEMGKMKFEKNTFQVSELFRNLQKNYTKLNEKNAKLAFSNHNSISITSDQKRIEQVLSNLINNSFNSITKENGLIEVSANDDGKSIIFSVKDNGKGIPKEFQDQIFKKFYQTDTGERRVHGGTGLGLSISQGIVEGLGGKIWVENGESHGCCLSFSIPKGNLN